MLYNCVESYHSQFSETLFVSAENVEVINLLSLLKTGINGYCVIETWAGAVKPRE